VRAADRAGAQRAVRSEAELAVATAKAEEGADASGDTRVAAGRRFRLVSGTWTDVAHKPDARTIRIAPYSEAYFALLDTLPELRAIWSVFDVSVVAGERVSLQVAEGGETSLTAAERTTIVRDFRGS
jgi:hypothetical protein